MFNVANRLTILMRTRNKTQRELAEYLDVPEYTVEGMTSRNYDFTVGEISKLAKFFKVSVSEVLA